ncbi:MAG: hypothetical protein KJ890_07160 [Gammaproteobacteria bacterium]|nr:hypothetical protein [Gammaproteobacteria bacterium]MBU0801634.1 hypothetical protein [Alphaproteobacteria bacterium]MBU1805229.1 hypothetical protein [Gammaproteobacteria bacterium]
MRYYLKTTDPLLIATFRSLKETAAARYMFFIALAREWGFDEIGMHEFGEPHFFSKLMEGRDRKGPAIEGFKGGELIHHNGKRYFQYTFHGKNKRASELRKQFADAPPLPSELLGEQYNFGRRNVDTVFTKRTGLPDGVWEGNRISFALCHLLDGDVLVCSLPFNTLTDKEAAPAVIPEGFEEITERAWVAEIDRHNAAVAA